MSINEELSEGLASTESEAEYGEILGKLALENLDKILSANDFPVVSMLNINTFEDLYFRALLPITGRRKSYEITTYLSAKCLQPHMYSGDEISDNPHAKQFQLEYATEVIYEAMLKRIREEGISRLHKPDRLKLEKEAALLKRYMCYSLGRIIGGKFPKTVDAVQAVLARNAA